VKRKKGLAKSIPREFLFQGLSNQGPFFDALARLSIDLFGTEFYPVAVTDIMPERQEIAEIFQFFRGSELMLQGQRQNFLVIAAGFVRNFDAEPFQPFFKATFQPGIVLGQQLGLADRFEPSGGRLLLRKSQVLDVLRQPLKVIPELFKTHKATPAS